MKIRSFLFAAILFVGLVFPAAARAVSIQEISSSQGVKAWLVEDHSLPIMALQFAFRGGVEQDTPDKQGLSILAADLLTQGAGDFDAKAFQKALADQSISFGLSAGRDTIDGSLKTLTATRDDAARLAHLALAKPRFDEDALARTRRQQQVRIQMMLGDPSWQARRALFAHLFPAHPYSLRSLGTAQTLAAITPEDLRHFAATRMAKDNLLVAVAGDITPEDLRPLLDRIFGDLPDHATLAPVPDVTPETDGTTTLVTRQGVQTSILFAAPGVKRDDPDWFAASILDYVLGGGSFSSRLMQDVRDERGLTYGISTSLAAMEHAGLLIGEAQTDERKAAKAWEVTRRVWNDLYRNGVSADELAKAQSYLTGSLPLSFTSLGATAGVVLQVQKDRLGRDYLDRRNDMIRAVTLEDVRRVARRLLDPKKLTSVMVGEPGGIKAASRQSMVRE